MPEKAKEYKIDAKAIKDLLKAAGMKASELDKKKWDTEKNIKRSLLELHSITEIEYRANGGTL